MRRGGGGRSSSSGGHFAVDQGHHGGYPDQQQLPSYSDGQQQSNQIFEDELFGFRTRVTLVDRQVSCKMNDVTTQQS